MWEKKNLNFKVPYYLFKYRKVWTVKQVETFQRQSTETSTKPREHQPHDPRAELLDTDFKVTILKIVKELKENRKWRNQCLKRRGIDKDI